MPTLGGAFAIFAAVLRASHMSRGSRAACWSRRCSLPKPSYHLHTARACLLGGWISLLLLRERPPPCRCRKGLRSDCCGAKTPRSCAKISARRRPASPRASASASECSESTSLSAGERSLETRSTLFSMVVTRVLTWEAAAPGRPVPAVARRAAAKRWSRWQWPPRLRCRIPLLRTWEQRGTDWRRVIIQSHVCRRARHLIRCAGMMAMIRVAHTPAFTSQLKGGCRFRRGTLLFWARWWPRHSGRSRRSRAPWRGTCKIVPMAPDRECLAPQCWSLRAWRIGAEPRRDHAADVVDTFKGPAVSTLKPWRKLG